MNFHARLGLWQAAGLTVGVAVWLAVAGTVLTPAEAVIIAVGSLAVGASCHRTGHCGLMARTAAAVVAFVYGELPAVAIVAVGAEVGTHLPGWLRERSSDVTAALRLPLVPFVVVAAYQAGDRALTRDLGVIGDTHAGALLAAGAALVAVAVVDAARDGETWTRPAPVALLDDLAVLLSGTLAALAYPLVGIVGAFAAAPIIVAATYAQRHVSSVARTRREAWQVTARLSGTPGGLPDGHLERVADVASSSAQRLTGRRRRHVTATVAAHLHELDRSVGQTGAGARAARVLRPAVGDAAAAVLAHLATTTPGGDDADVVTTSQIVHAACLADHVTNGRAVAADDALRRLLEDHYGREVAGAVLSAVDAQAGSRWPLPSWAG